MTAAAGRNSLVAAMTVDGTSGPRRARHVAPLATGLVFVLVVVGCLFAGHGHLPGFEPGKRDASDTHGSAKGGCSICSLAHHPSVAVDTPPGSIVEDREVGPKSQRELPFGAAPCADEQSPRGPPRSALS